MTLQLFIQLPRVDHSDNDILCALQSMEEIRSVVLSMSPDSAPSPDGFSAGFYQRCWEIIKKDLLQAVQDFFTGGQQPHGFTSSLIVLIPKVQGASQ